MTLLLVSDDVTRSDVDFDSCLVNFEVILVEIMFCYVITTDE